MSALLRRPVRLAAAGLAGALVAGLLAAAPSTAAPGGLTWDPEAECTAPAIEAAPDDANRAPVLAADTLTVRGGTITDVDALANDTDPDGDTLTVAGTTEPNRGTSCILDSGDVRYLADPTRRDRTATFSYAATDGDRLRSAQVTVQVEGTQTVKPVLRVPLRTDKKGKVTRRAALRFTNPNDVPVTIFAESANSGRDVLERRMNPGGSFVWRTGLERVFYVAAMDLDSEDPYFVNVGIINTRTGRHPRTYVGASFSAYTTTIDDSELERRGGRSLLDLGRAIL